MATRKRKAQTVPVGARALLLRINRVLEADGRVLKKTRGARAEMELGRYYVIDQRRHVIVDKDVDLQALGRKLDALKEYEHLVDDDE
jgi:hypothetical protein